MKDSCPYCEGSLSIFNNNFICNDCNAKFKRVKGKLKTLREEY